MDDRKTKPFPWMCPNCRTKTVSLVQRDYQVAAEHDGAGYEISIHDALVPSCSQCGQAIITTDLSERVSAQLRLAAGLLSPEWIRSKRESLGLTQGELAAAIRVPETTLVRWETGMQLQSRALDLLLRLYLDSEAVRQACIRVSRPPNAVSTAPAPAT